MSKPDLDRREAVQRAYSAAARDPSGDHPFAVGRELALGVGYPAEVLDRVPASSVAAFAGVAAVSLECVLAPGDRVLDLGCGGGLDALVAAGRIGGGGLVAGVDFSAEMLGRARRGRDELGAGAVSLCPARPRRSGPFATAGLAAPTCLPRSCGPRAERATARSVCNFTQSAI